VVRAWIEPSGERADVRARVLVIEGADAQLHELGLAVGDDAIARLVVQALAEGLGLAGPED